MSELGICDVDDCVAMADAGDGFCVVHYGAKRIATVMAGTRCTRCKRRILADQRVTRESTLDAMTHAVCPPPGPYRGHKREQWKPLLDEL